MSRRSQNSADVQFNDKWERIAQAIRDIHKKNIDKNFNVERFVGIHRDAYYMVLHGDKLYNGVRGIITQHLEEVVSTQVVPQINPNGAGGANFLKVLKNVWENHTTCMLMIRDILMYMVS